MSFSDFHRFAPVPLRLAVGSILTYHGWEKLFGGDPQRYWEGAAGYGLPYNEIVNQIAAWGEFAGGILILLGLATRVAALVNVYAVIITLWKLHFANGPFMERAKDLPEYEFPLLVLAVCLSLVCSGAGMLSLDAHIRPHRVHPPLS